MANEYCKYHPLTNAVWHCTTCCINLCDECVHPLTEHELTPTCLLCGQLTVSLQQPKAIVPFWLQYTNFLRLPLSLLGIFLLVFLFILPQLVPFNLALPATGFAYFIAAYYGSNLLQQTLSGTLKDISLLNLIKSSNSLFVKLSLLIACVLTGLDILSGMMQGVALLLSIGAVLLFPAMLISVIVEKQLSALVQFNVLKDVLIKLKFYYLPIIGALLLLWSISFAIIRLLTDVLPITTAQGLEQALYSYGLWVMMSVVGYVLYQFNQLFDLELTQHKTKRRSIVKTSNKQEARLEVFLKEGAYDKAANLLKTLAEKQPNNPELQERYYQILVFMQDIDLIPIQANNYISALLANGQGTQAIQVFKRMQRLIPEFKPQTPEVSFDLAKSFMEKQEYEQVIGLLSGLHKGNPHFAALPEAYLLLSKVLFEKMGRQQEALETVEYLVARFQKHPRFELIDKVWRALGGKPKQDFII